LTTTFGHLAMSPRRENLVATTDVGADASYASAVIEDDGQAGQSAREIRALGKLGEARGHVEHEAKSRNLSGPRAVVGIEIHAGARGACDPRIGVPCAGTPDAAEAIRRGIHLGFEHTGDACARHEIRVADNSSRDPRPAVETGRGHGGDAIGELDLAHVFHLVGPVGPEHGQMLDENRRDDVVAAPVDVAQDLVEHVAAIDATVSAIPKVMVRIADGQLGLDRRFFHHRQPGIIRCHGRLLTAKSLRDRCQPMSGFSSLMIDEESRSPLPFSMCIA